MATAYAALTSLMHLISDLRQHPNPPIRLEDEYVESLGSKISFFQRFLEDHHTSIDLELELRIADAAYAAEDVIETQIADRVLDQVDFSGSLQKVIEAMDLIEREVVKMNWNTVKKSQRNNKPLLRPANDSGENFVVGIEDLTTEIVDKLTLPIGSGRQIVSITGMGGIGKTTLADKVYNHPYVSDYFDVRAWATISKDYNIHESLIELIHCLDRTERKEFFRVEEEYNLGDKLYKSLFGKRYLIIVDDLWDVEAWERLRSFFPDSRGSGIVITTRESKFASISSHVFAVDLLDKRKSWDLLCRTVFEQDDCPFELEDAGKEISDNCRGLPLSVVVIGGHLAKSPRTQEYWEYIAGNLGSILDSEDGDSCLKILSLSYIHLPVHLKPCFLYMGIFPEDADINVEILILLWVAEGFLKPIDGKSLEEAAEDYIQDLVSRNLILVSMPIYGCKIHDLLRDLCLKEASEKKFLRTVRKEDTEVPDNERRIVIYPRSYDEDHCHPDTIVQKSPWVVRTVILHDKVLPPVVYKSLRVLVSTTGTWKISLANMEEVTRQLVNLRCLAFQSYKWGEFVTFPSSIFSSWNLQHLYILGNPKAKAPEEIWKMSQLRHIHAMGAGISLPNPPPPSESHGDDDILKNLQSVEKILNLSFSEDLVRRIPYVKKLHVEYNDSSEGFGEGVTYSLNNIARLEKLESLACWVDGVASITQRNDMLSSLAFPHSLKTLLISSVRLDEATTMFGSLPLLEELSMFWCSGSKWNLVEGKFLRLKSLQFYNCGDLKCFTADSNHFPCLEELILLGMDSLVEISSDVGDIQALRRLELHGCPDSAVVCAKEIAEYQKHEMGNEQLQIEAILLYESSLSAESLSASNFNFFPD